VRFELKAGIIFEAKDIDDAFLKLSEHFRRLSQEEDYDESPFELGQIRVAPDDDVT